MHPPDSRLRPIAHNAYQLTCFAVTVENNYPETPFRVASLTLWPLGTIPEETFFMQVHNDTLLTELTETCTELDAPKSAHVPGHQRFHWGTFGRGNVPCTLWKCCSNTLEDANCFVQQMPLQRKHRVAGAAEDATPPELAAIWNQLGFCSVQQKVPLGCNLSVCPSAKKAQ